MSIHDLLEGFKITLGYIALFSLIGLVSAVVINKLEKHNINIFR